MCKLFYLLFCCVAVSMAKCLKLVPMTEWSGRETLRQEPLRIPVDIAVIQHTVTKECFTDEECEVILKSMQKYQMDLGFDDIGYSFMIGGNGKVYEGAGWEKRGAHTMGYNDKSIGIAFIGDFREKLPTAEAIEQAQFLLTYGLNMKYLSEDYKLLGHRQLSGTISPGDALFEEIKQWPHWTENV